MIFCESKWRAGEGRWQGLEGRSTPLELRSQFLEKHGRRIYGDVGFAVVYIQDPGKTLRSPRSRKH